MTLNSEETTPDRRTPLAILLCVIIFIAWQKFYLEPRSISQRPSAQPQTTSSGNPASMAPLATSGQTAAVAPAVPQELVSVPLTVSTGVMKIGNGAAFIADWTLKDYRLGVAKDDPVVDLKSVTNRTVGEIRLSFDDPGLAYLSADTIRANLAPSAFGTSWVYSDDNVRISREFITKPDQPFADVQVNVTFKTRVPSRALVSVSSQSSKDDPEAMDRQFFYLTQGSIELAQVEEAVSRKEVATPVKYIGAGNRYFVLSVLDRSSADPKALIEPTGAFAGQASLVYPVAGKDLSIPLRIYFGPKDLGILRSVDPALDHAVDLGMFTVIAYPLLNLLNLFYKWFHNYGIAIILLTVLVKIVLYPLTYKSMKSMKEMAKIQPQLARLREKYKDDKEGLNREMLTLMRSHGYNPMAGCLPMLVQMPVFFALYRVLYSSIELYHAPFVLWIQDLAAKDPYFVTPVLLTVTMYIQQKISPQTATDPAQQKMMQFMPILFGAFMLTLPSGLTIYMLVNAIVSIAQQSYLNKKLA